jgi:hypothetical protein
MSSKKKGWTWGLRLLAVAVLVALFSLPLAGRASAAEIITGDPNVVIEEGEVIEDDLFVSGALVEMNGTVRGDLFMTGQELVLNGEVEGTVFFGGQIIRVNGEVDGSVFAGGYVMTLGPEANIERSLYFGGFSLELEEGSYIARSLYTGNYQTILDGQVERDVTAGAGAFELSGTVGGDVKVDLGEIEEDTDPTEMMWMGFVPGGVRVVPPGFRQADDADVGGEVSYTVRKVKVEGLEVTPPEPERVVRFVIAGWLRQRIGEFLALLIVGALLLRFFPALLLRSGAYLQDRPLPSAGYGCLATLAFIIGVPLALGLVFLAAILGGLVTLGSLFSDVLGLGGATIGLVIAAFMITVSLLTKAVVSFLVGKKILDQLTKGAREGYWYDVGALAIGLLIYEILRAIPLGFGWLVGVIVTLVGLGAIYFAMRKWLAPDSITSPEEATA